MSRVRIIGGEWRGRLVSFDEAPGLRPTPDRVRETLFNWLGQDLTGWNCLDLFAGSGVLGFEAASRGAAQVTLVDSQRRVCRRLQENADVLGRDRLQVVCANALKFLALCVRRFDLVFLDPPYSQGWIEQLTPVLADIVAPQAWVYVEAEGRLDTLGDWHTVRRGKAGQVHYHLMRAGES